MAKTGRPRKAEPDDVMRAVQLMIDEHQKTDDVRSLSDYRLAEILGVSTETIDNFYSGESDHRRVESLRKAGVIIDNIDDINETNGLTMCTYYGAVKKLVDYRRAECTAHIASRGGNVTGWIFLSKQPRWGGFQDIQRTETRGSQAVTVTIRGADGKQLDV